MYESVRHSNYEYIKYLMFTQFFPWQIVWNATGLIGVEVHKYKLQLI